MAAGYVELNKATTTGYGRQPCQESAEMVTPQPLLPNLACYHRIGLHRGTLANVGTLPR